MHVVVLGAGAIGSLYGAKLSARHHVTLVGRPDHVNAIRQSGLRLVGAEQGLFRVEAATEPPALEPDALVLLTTKATDSLSAVAALMPRLPAHGVTMLCVQNGLYVERQVAEVVGPRACVLRAITQFGAILREPGVVDFKAAGHTLVEAHDRAAAIATALTESGLDGRIATDIRREMWRKAIFNCVINPITSIVGCEVGGIANPALDPLKRLVVEECLAVARADGIVFDDVDFIGAITAIFGASRNTASMRIDLLKRRRTEIDYLNGAVADLGTRFGIACPVNDALATIIRQLEQVRRAERGVGAPASEELGGVQGSPPFKR